MTDLSSLGRVIMAVGVALLIAGGLMSLLGRGWRLPGDILIRRDSFTIYIPIATSIVLSLVVTLVLSLFARR
jgi:hypothetical protein